VLQRRRPRPDQGLDHTAAIGTPELAGRPAALIEPVAPASHACCCPAAPAFQIVLPGSEQRPWPTEILLCGHHYREHRRHLLARGAATYDRTGWPVDLPA
jgi:hypothetical protein